MYVPGKTKKLGAQPKGIASRGDLTAIVTLKSLILMNKDSGAHIVFVFTIYWSTSIRGRHRIFST